MCYSGLDLVVDYLCCMNFGFLEIEGRSGAASVKRIILLSLNTQCSSTVYQTSCFGSPNRDGGKIIIVIVDKMHVARLSTTHGLTPSNMYICEAAL